MLKKLWYKAGTRFVIAALFFLYTIYILIKIVIMHLPAPDVDGTKASYWGWIQGYYMAPFISAFLGYLFFKSGKRIQKNKAGNEDLETSK